MKVVRLEPLSVIRELLLRQQAANDRHRLARTCQRLVGDDAVSAMHEADATRAQSEGAKAAARQVMDRARAHGQQSRRARVEVHDRRAKADRLRLSGEDRQDRECVLAGLLRGAESRVAELLPVSNPLDELFPRQVPGVAGEAELAAAESRIQSS